MRLRFSLLILLSALTGIAQSGLRNPAFVANLHPIGTSTLNDSLVAYWTIDEASGNLADCVGGNTFTENGTITRLVVKINNGATNNNTASRYFSIADNATFSAGVGKSFTVALWVRPNGAGRSWFASKYNNTGNNIEWYIDWDVNSKFGFSMSTNGVENGVYYQTTASYGAETNYLVTFGFDATSRLFVGSVTPPWGTPEFLNTTEAGALFDGNANFELLAVSSASVWCSGALDEVGYWNRLLTTNEVSQLWNSNNGKQGCPFAP